MMWHNGKDSGESDTDLKPRELINVFGRTTARLVEVEMIDTEREAERGGPQQHSKRFSFSLSSCYYNTGRLGLLTAREARRGAERGGPQQNSKRGKERSRERRA